MRHPLVPMRTRSHRNEKRHNKTGMKRHLTILAFTAAILFGMFGANLAMGYTEAGLLKGMKGGEWEMGLQYDQWGFKIE